jgi:IS5 family transposase
MISLHGLRIFLGETYEMIIDRLEVMLPVLEIVGLKTDDLPDPSTLNMWFDWMVLDVGRVRLRRMALQHDPSPHVAVDATYYERSPASKHYCDRTSYRVQTVEATKLVDTESQAILGVHCTTTREGSDADVCAQLARWYVGQLQTLAADKGYGSQPLHETLREMGIRPLVKDRVFVPYDHAHNARIEDDLYNLRSMTETANSLVKRSYGSAVRAREWYREFREVILMCLVYNIKQHVTP